MDPFNPCLDRKIVSRPFSKTVSQTGRYNFVLSLSIRRVGKAAEGEGV